MSSTESSADRTQKDTAPSTEGWLARLRTALGFKSTASIRDDIEDALEAKGQGGDFTPQERAMLRNILSIRSVRVADVMIPRADIVAVPSDISLQDLLRVFRTKGHSRLPAYGETLDDPKGMVHIRDFLDFLSTRAETVPQKRRKGAAGASINLGLVDLSTELGATKLLRPVLYAPPSMPAMDLLVRMQATRTHMALVVDEYGGTDGLVSIEDLVEMIVGDIEDEHDDAGRALIERDETAGDGRFVAEAKAALEDVGRALGVDFADEPAAADVDTIGGLIVTLAQRVPSRGELIGGPLDLEFEVLDADPRRIKRVRIYRKTANAAAGLRLNDRDPTIEDAAAPAPPPRA
ncbi:MAG: hemolysin family protein [Beijerinckiaceae bacterium]